MKDWIKFIKKKSLLYRHVKISRYIFKEYIDLNMNK